jgi:hypothetical protein
MSFNCGLHIFVTKSSFLNAMSSSAELNRGVGEGLSFLWYHDSPSRGNPIVELKILNSEEECPEGFEKIPRNMLLGSDQCAFLFIRRCKAVDPIGEIRILYGDESKADDGFTRIFPPVYGGSAGSKSVSLTVSTVSKGTLIYFALSLIFWTDDFIF